MGKGATLVPEHVRLACGREVGQLLGRPLGTPLKEPGGPRASWADQAGHIVAGHITGGVVQQACHLSHCLDRH